MSRRFAILKRYLFGPLSSILDEREREAASAEKVHSESLSELQKTIARAEAELAKARGEALAIREKLRGEGREQSGSVASQEAHGCRGNDVEPGDRRDRRFRERRRRGASTASARARTAARRKDPRPEDRRVTIHAFASLLAWQAAGEHLPSGPLGLPMWIWQLVNLVGILRAASLFRRAADHRNVPASKQLEVEDRVRESRERRAAAARLETEIHERMARLDVELAEIRARGAAEGESARAELMARAEQDSERVRRDVTEEIERRLILAKEELHRTAAELTASAARELVSAQITSDDRRRLLEESVDMVQREGSR